MKIAITNDNDLPTWIQNLQEFQLDSIFETIILGRAYDYIPKVNNISLQKNKVTCQIDGTSIYVINIEMVGKTINATCNCPYDRKCKHMAAVILSLMNVKWGTLYNTR